VEIEKADQFASADANVVIASVPTLGRQNSSRLESFAPKDYKLIIVDEAHHSVAATYMRIANHFGLLDTDTHIKLFGFTATVHRNDDLALGNLFQKIAFHMDIRTLLAHKWYF
jgi:ATP-dependent helicase IRC3